MILVAKTMTVTTTVMLKLTGDVAQAFMVVKMMMVKIMVEIMLMI